jgi:hypothetical protein
MDLNILKVGEKIEKIKFIKKDTEYTSLSKYTYNECYCVYYFYISDNGEKAIWVIDDTNFKQGFTESYLKENKIFISILEQRRKKLKNL